ncbi:hypothetical protein GCM10025860_06100 [Methanobacterium ferruginis]|nr:hypothetical protein GCM10025860_06100 [Methanobacterium ferruginis]
MTKIIIVMPIFQNPNSSITSHKLGLITLYYITKAFSGETTLSNNIFILCNTNVILNKIDDLIIGSKERY